MNGRLINSFTVLAALAIWAAYAPRMAAQTQQSPRIVEPPRPLVRIVGEPALFKVVAEGAAPLRYQWFFDGSALLRETNAMLMIPRVTLNHQGKYSVEVRNAFGSVHSPSAALTVLVPPLILTHPKNQDVKVGETATFFVEATGTQPLKYQWLRNGVIIPGETNSVLTIDRALPRDAGSYRVAVANSAGAVLSEVALLRVDIPFQELADKFDDAPLIREPSALFRTSNRGASSEPGEPLHAGKHGGKSVWFAWVSDKEGILTVRTRGSHIDTLLAAYVGDKLGGLKEVASDEDSGGFLTSEISFNVEPGTRYFIAIDGYNGAEGEIVVEWFFESTAERLPMFVEQPLDQVVKLGSDVTFRVDTSNPDLSFQWFFNGQPVGDGPVLNLRSVRREHAGLYYALATDGRRSAISRMVLLQFSAVGPTGEVIELFARDKFGDIVARPEGLGGAAGGGFAAAAMAGPPVVHGYAGTHLFSTFGAIKEEGEPNHCGVIGGASYWFSYVPPASGQLFLDTDGSSYDTVLAVYTANGTGYSNLVSVACDNDSGTNGLTSSLSFAASAGVNYYIVVDGVDAATGLVQLNYQLLVPLMISDASLTNSFRFRVTATPFLPFTIQRSANLSGWTSVLTTNTATGIFDYLDTNSAVRRFYRVTQTP